MHVLRNKRTSTNMPSSIYNFWSAKFVNEVINSYRYHSVIIMYRIMGSVQAENRQRSELIVHPLKDATNRHQRLSRTRWSAQTGSLRRTISAHHPYGVIRCMIIPTFRYFESIWGDAEIDVNCPRSTAWSNILSPIPGLPIAKKSLMTESMEGSFR